MCTALAVLRRISFVRALADFFPPFIIADETAATAAPAAIPRPTPFTTFMLCLYMASNLQIQIAAFKTYKTAEIAGWIKTHARSKDISLNDDAVSLLIEQIGNNLREFDTELDKLKLIAYPEKKVTRKMVEEICISNEDLFGFADLIMQGERDKALLEFNKLLDKKHPLEILSAIQTMIRKWIILKTKSSLSPGELSKLTGQHEFVVKQTLQKLKNTKTADLVKLKENLYEAEFRIKSAEAIDIISEVECAIIG